MITGRLQKRERRTDNLSRARPHVRAERSRWNAELGVVWRPERQTTPTVSVGEER